jgi:hypothetical protein
MTLKNVSKGTEGEFTTLRLNFNTPGQIAKKEEIVVHLLTLGLSRHDTEIETAFRRCHQNLRAGIDFQIFRYIPY